MGANESGGKFLRTVAIVTVSDRSARGEREDVSGQVLAERLLAEGFDIKSQMVVPDEVDEISTALRQLADHAGVALIVTTGGTGLAPRDVTPEATERVLTRTIPGMAEAMRAASLAKTPHAMLSRAVVGVRGTTLIVNLPGNPKAIGECLPLVIPAIREALRHLRE